MSTGCLVAKCEIGKVIETFFGGNRIKRNQVYLLVKQTKSYFANPILWKTGLANLIMANDMGMYIISTIVRTSGKAA